MDHAALTTDVLAGLVVSESRGRSRRHVGFCYLTAIVKMKVDTNCKSTNDYDFDSGCAAERGRASASRVGLRGCLAQPERVWPASEIFYGT